MPISDAELAVHRTNTVQFILADSVEVVLVRRTRVSDGAGGHTWSPAPLPVQVMRLIPLGDGATERQNQDGVLVRPSYMLMGEHDADMERWDRFYKDGREYEIVFVNDNRQYETKGEAVYLG